MSLFTTIKFTSRLLVASMICSLLIQSPAIANTLIPCSNSGAVQISGTILIDGSGCSGTLTVPSYVTDIAPDALNGVTGLSNISFERGSELEFIGGGAFAYTRGLTITLPEGLRTIDSGAFYNAGVSRITIPQTVTLIGADAFRTASLVQGIYFMGDAPVIGANAFFGINAQARVYIRSGASGFVIVNSNWNGVQVAPIGNSLRYDENLSSSGTIPSDPTPIYTNGAQITVLGNTKNLTRNGYSFVGWNTSPQGSGATYVSGDTFLMSTQDVTLFAKWSANSHNVVFDSKGGDAVPDSTFQTGGSLLAPTSPTKAGYTFAGWSASDGGGVIEFPYAPGVINNITLFATWNLIPNSSVDRATNPEIVDTAAVDIASRTISVKDKWGIKNLALRTGVTIASPKAKVSISIAKSSRKICSSSRSKLKTLKTGNCVVTFTVQEPKPKKGKKPKATKTVKTLIVQ